MTAPAALSWSRYLPWARAVLAALALALGFLYPGALSWFIRGLMGLFLIYTMLLALRGRGGAGLLGLLTLIGDTVYFLVLASLGLERTLWLPSLFYLFLLTEALAFYTPIQLAVTSGACTLFCFILPSETVRHLQPTVVVGGLLACAFGLSRTRLKLQNEALIEKAREAQIASEKARDVERQRIASDFHDGPLQSFISLQMRLEILRKLLERDLHAGMEDLKQLQSLALTQIRDLRAFLHSMRPVDVDGANLIATARRNAEAFQKESGIPLTFIGTDTPVGLPQEMTAEVLQMLKEAMANVQKHSGASRVAVAIDKTEHGLEVSVEDNGHGFNFAGTYTLEELELLRLGPASLKRRARSLNAELILESRPGRGAGLKFRIPLQ
jgi:signal transduction histidine kinase